MSRKPIPLVVAALFGPSLLLALLAAAPPETTPPPGLRSNTPNVHVITSATVTTEPGKTIPNAVIVVRDGVITAVGPAGSVELPKDARTWDASGKQIYAGLIDSYSEFSPELLVAAPAGGGRQGAPYWNTRVTPEMRVSRAYRPDREANARYRGQGVVARVVAPAAGIIKGTSAVVDTGSDDGMRAIVREDVAQHVALEPGRGGFGGGRRGEVPEAERYPTSPMGAFTLVRQALYDARWYADAWKAVASTPTLPRPERNDALASLADELEGKTPLVIDGSDELYALRAHRIGEEFGVPVIVRGSGQEFRLLTEIAATKRPVIVPLAFPRAPSVTTPEQVASTSLMDLMAWDLAPENPARLERAGVPIALTGFGITAQGETFLGQVRKAVARGLPPDAALRAMTVTPAALFNVEDSLGTIAVGKSASFIVTDGDLFGAGTKLLETWVDGQRFEITAVPPLDPRGRWELKVGERTLNVSLAGELPQLTGETQRGGGRRGATTEAASEATPQGAEVAATQPAATGLATTGPATTSPASQPGGGRGRGSATGLSDVAVIDTRVSFTLRGDNVGGGPGIASVSFTVVGDRAFGVAVLPDGSRVDVTARRLEPTSRPASRPTTGPSTKPASYEPNYPLGEYGAEALPAQPGQVLFRNATVWTGEGQGRLEGASVLVEGGKIAQIYEQGATPKLPDGAQVVDCTGKHLTAGIIDSHSHFATDGGVNESGQTITAEVRIADFIDPSDITIYRQLGGGVTSSLILHGSANTIGGQSQVVKLRWGAGPEALKFAEAPPGIKFALGENPKQSNWGDTAVTRYPQTRMGVEQLVRDEFKAAQEYRAGFIKHQADPTHLLPPRRDLELEAVAEILEGKRWIHCHSYRQDEILDLIRTTKEFAVTVGSLQHILEGYKVADEIAKAGISACGFADWWAYKIEVIDAIPYSPSIMFKEGVNCALNSDDAELATRLNHEAAKVVKYGGVPELEAWKMVTLNPAKALRIDSRVGSIAAGKDADLVVWSESPMKSTTRAEQTWVDGRMYFSVEKDAQLRAENARRHAALVQKALASDEPGAGPGDAPPTRPSYWERYDEFCKDCVNVHR